MTLEEQRDIITWFSPYLVDFRNRLVGNRIHIEINNIDPRIPKAVLDIRKRIIEREGLKGYLKEPELGDFAAAILKDGVIHPHLDSNFGDYIHTRFNVFVSNPKDGNYTTYYKGVPVEEKERHYTLCRSGLDLHWSNVNTNQIPRITLSFGFLIPTKKLDTFAEPLKPTNKQFLYYLLKLLEYYFITSLLSIPFFGIVLYKLFLKRSTALR